jgi:LuxR family maltose regulon positive regulatory protein
MRKQETAETLHWSLPVEPLTEREQSILNYIAEGLSDPEIAERLSVALDTVKWYNKRIYGKLDVRQARRA